MPALPDISDNWLSLGRTLEQMEDSEAGNAYDRAHHLAPENPDTALALGPMAQRA